MPLPESESITTLVAKRIKELRIARGFTQESLAQALGIATKNVQRIEGGKQNLTLLSLDAIASVLNVEAQDLFAPLGSHPRLDSAGTLERALKGLARLGHRVLTEDETESADAIPVMTLEAAAGKLGSARSVDVFAWVKLKGVRAATGRFITQVVGNSMAPTIPGGALCLFRAPVVGPLSRRIVLVQVRSATDADDAGTYVVKRVGAIELAPEGGLHVQLESDNKSHETLRVSVEHASDLGILAEFDRVIWPAPPLSPRSRQ